MKPILVALLLLGGLEFPGIAADKGGTVTSRLAQVDLDLTLEQYKQVRMEQFKAEMRAQLLRMDEFASEDVRKDQHDRQDERLNILQEMADKLRVKAMKLEESLSAPPREQANVISHGEYGAVPVAESELRKRMLGTWQLVSFADGTVSQSNVGELKFIGDRHWSVSRVNPRTGKLEYHMGGTYTLDGDEYTETIGFGTSGPIGETYTYKLTVQDDKFIQIGVKSPWSLVFKRAK